MSLRFGVGTDKQADLDKRMAALRLREEDLVEKFIRASGPGGQHVNKTSSAVYLKHIPTGVEVKSQSARSQTFNRYEARLLLVEKLERRRTEAKSAAIHESEKLRRQKRKRSKGSKERMLKDKRSHAQKKANRGRVTE